MACCTDTGSWANSDTPVVVWVGVTAETQMQQTSLSVEYNYKKKKNNLAVYIKEKHLQFGKPALHQQPTVW